MRILSYLLLFVASFYLLGCKKTQSEIDSQAIKDYISAHHLNAVVEPNGVYFVAGSGGNGTYASSATLATVTYKGYLTNGAVFDQSTSPYTFNLAQVVGGLQEGIPLMQRGQSATILMPSAMGYGTAAEQATNGYANIPANSVLIFDISLISFQ